MSLRARITLHLRELFRSDPHPVPWQKMVLCAAATCVPLTLGASRGELGVSIYGALVGYLLSLNNDLGTLRHRMGTVSVTFVILVAGFTSGLLLRTNHLEFLAVFAVMSYGLGVLAGEGVELERAFLFATSGMLIANSTKGFLPQATPFLLFYICVAYGVLLLGLPTLELFWKPEFEPSVALLRTFRKSLSLKREKHVHAAVYALVAVGSLVLVQSLEMERGYWVTLTVLLVMKPDRRQALYRGFQRLIGTLIAVALADVLIQRTQDPRLLIALAVGAAFGVPWGLKRNYSWVAFFVTLLVVFLLELASTRHGDVHTPYIRLRATLAGCLLALLGTGLSHSLDVITRPSDRER